MNLTILLYALYLLSKYFFITLTKFSKFYEKTFKDILVKKYCTYGFEKITKLHVHAKGNDWACQTIYFWYRKNVLNVSNSKTRKYKGFRLTPRIYLEVTSLKWKYFVAVLFKRNIIVHFNNILMITYEFLSIYERIINARISKRLFFNRIHWYTNYFISKQLVKHNHNLKSLVIKFMMRTKRLMYTIAL